MDTLEKLALLGAKHLFDGHSYYNSHLDSDSVRRDIFNSGFLDSQLESMNPVDNQTMVTFLSFSELASEKKITSSSFMAAAVKRYSSIDFIEINANEIARGVMSCVFVAAERNPNFVWKDLFDALYASRYGKLCGYTYDGVKKALSKCTEQDPSGVVSFIEKELFKADTKPHHHWRSLFYQEFIKTGSLTKKYARKIRSESSAESSVCGVRALIANKDLYTNYDELLLTMSDSRHEDVLALLARNLPIHLLASIMGTQSRNVLSIIEQRMADHEKEQEIIKREQEREIAKMERMNSIIENAPDLLGDLFK